MLLLPAAGLYPALAAACVTEAAVLQRLQQEFEQQPPEQQRSLANPDALLLSVHFNLSKWLLSLWMFTATAALNESRCSAAFAPVASCEGGAAAAADVLCSNGKPQQQQQQQQWRQQRQWQQRAPAVRSS
jgi:hypothetical protein